MYYTGLDPFTKKPVTIAKGLNDRKMQRALMQFFKPTNWFEVREALIQAERTDLIGGCDGLIPANPPKEAIEARRKRANQGGDHYHTVANPAEGDTLCECGAEPRKPTGYRPGRKTHQRQHGKQRKGSGPATDRPASARVAQHPARRDRRSRDNPHSVNAVAPTGEVSSWRTASPLARRCGTCRVARPTTPVGCRPAR